MGASTMAGYYRKPQATAKAIDADLRFADAPFWQYVPTRSALLFAVKDLNGDERPDVLLYHSTAVTILVSAQ